MWSSSTSGCRTAPRARAEPSRETGTQPITPGLVSAIVVNWNGKRLLHACLDALASQGYSPVETIVVDNGSTDGSAELASGRPHVRLIRNAENAGFAVANNQGLELASGEFILLLNYDAVLQPGYISTLVKSLRADSRRGSATGKLLRPTIAGQPTLLDSTGHVMYRNVQATNRGENQPDRTQYDRAEEMFGVCAAAALYRRAMLDDVAVDGEILDASFFAYLEDVDLDWRARLRGWSAWYEPSVVAIHHRSASGGRFTMPTQRHIFKNRILMMVKNDGGPGFYRRLPAIAAFTAAKLLLGISHGPAFLGAISDVLRFYPAARRKRRLVQSRRTVRADSIEAWFRPYPYLQKLRHAKGKADNHLA